MGSHLLLMISSTLVLVYSRVLCFSNKILLQFVQSILVLDADEFTASDKEVPAVYRMLSVLGVFLDSWPESDDVVAFKVQTSVNSIEGRAQSSSCLAKKSCP